METSQLTGISRGKFADLRIKRAGSFQDINAVLDGITDSVDLNSYYTSVQTDAAIQVETDARTAAVQAETDARNLLATNTATALASKQVTLVAGDNIQLSGGSNSATISATGPLEVAVDGTLQTATRVDFVAPTSSLTSGVLSIGPPDFQSRLSLIYASSADALDLTRSQAGGLLWDGAEVASKASVDDERTARQTFQSDTNIVLNTKQTVDDPQTRVRLGTTADNKDLTKSGASLAWGGNTLVEAPTLNVQLALKQDTLTAGTGISISGATISATGGSTLELAVNGTTQTGATKLDFLANEATLSSGTLYLGPPLTTRVGLWFASQADHKDLTQGSGGTLLWDGAAVAMASSVPDLSASTTTLGGTLSVEGGSITLSEATTTFGYGLPLWSFRAGQTNYFSLGFDNTGSNSQGTNDEQALRVTRTGTITTSSSIGSHSDERLKTDVQEADANVCMALLRSVTPKTYKRIDRQPDQTRLGFIAQDLQSDAFPNLVFEDPAEGLLALDYARLVAPLWSVCKTLDARVAALEAVAANP